MDSEKPKEDDFAWNHILELLKRIDEKIGPNLDGIMEK